MVMKLGKPKSKKSSSKSKRGTKAAKKPADDDEDEDDLDEDEDDEGDEDDADDEDTDSDDEDDDDDEEDSEDEDDEDEDDAEDDDDDEDEESSDDDDEEDEDDEDEVDKDDDDEDDEDSDSDDDDDDEGDVDEVTGWKHEGSKARSIIKTENEASQRPRRPVLWLKDGDTRKVRFRDEDQIALIYVHNSGPAQKFQKYTCKGRGCKFCKAGFKKTALSIFEVIDYKGYVDKKGKKHRNLTRFYEVTPRRYTNIRKIAERRGLTNRDIELSRTGTGQKTEYSAIPLDKTRLAPELKKLPRLATEFDKWYAPLSDQAAKAEIQRIGGAPQEDDK